MDTEQHQYQKYECENKEKLIEKIEVDELTLEKCFRSETYGVKSKIIPEKVKRYIWIFIDGEEVQKIQENDEEGHDQKVTPNLMRILKEEQLTDSWIKSLFAGGGTMNKKYFIMIMVAIAIMIFILRGLGVI